MSFFDKMKQKSLEKMLEKAAGSPEAQKLLKSMGASDTDLSGAMQAMKGMNFSALMGMFKAFTPGQRVTVEKIRAVFDAAMFQQFALKLNVPVEKAPEKIAEMMNLMMSQRPPSA